VKGLMYLKRRDSSRSLSWARGPDSSLRSEWQRAKGSEWQSK